MTANRFSLSSRIVGLIFGLVAILSVSGCVSSTSNTATYGGPSVSSVSAQRADAKKAVRQASRELRRTERELKAIERRMARDARKLNRKKISAKIKSALKKNLRKDKKALRKAKRAVRKNQRKLARAKRSEQRAARAIIAAKKRQANAKRKLALEAKRKAAERKLKDQQEAQNAIAKRGSSSITSSLFGRSDPALKNVRDYAARIDGSFPVAAVPISKMNKRYYRQQVRYSSRHKPGTVVVDTGSKFLYLIQSGGKAMRYGIGVGKAGFEWSGSAHIGWKQQWPKWTPPAEMIERRPELEKYSADNGGMPGGPANPLGARALYLMQGNVDTLYRLHGTPQWASIGTAASSGCIRLINQDVIDLYERVPNGAKVVVL